jgi:hypothetical protein
MRPHPNLGFQPTLAQQVAGIIQPGCQITVFHLLLDEPIFHRSIFFLELGGGAPQLLIFVFQVAQACFHLAHRRAAGENTRST